MHFCVETCCASDAKTRLMLFSRDRSTKIHPRPQQALAASLRPRQKAQPVIQLLRAPLKINSEEFVVSPIILFLWLHLAVMMSWLHAAKILATGTLKARLPGLSQRSHHASARVRKSGAPSCGKSVKIRLRRGTWAWGSNRQLQCLFDTCMTRLQGFKLHIGSSRQVETRN